MGTCNRIHFVRKVEKKLRFFLKVTYIVCISMEVKGDRKTKAGEDMNVEAFENEDLLSPILINYR